MIHKIKKNKTYKTAKNIANNDAKNNSKKNSSNLKWMMRMLLKENAKLNKLPVHKLQLQSPNFDKFPPPPGTIKSH